MEMWHDIRISVRQRQSQKEEVMRTDSKRMRVNATWPGVMLIGATVAIVLLMSFGGLTRWNLMASSGEADVRCRQACAGLFFSYPGR